MPIAVWGLIGQRNAPGVAPAKLDYLIEPWHLARSTTLLLGGGAAALAVACAGVLLAATRAGRLPRAWWQVLLPLVIAGALTGAGWRVVTAGTIGAHLGAAAVAILGVPLVVALLLWSVTRAVHLTAAGRRAERTSFRT